MSWSATAVKRLLVRPKHDHITDNNSHYFDHPTVILTREIKCLLWNIAVVKGSTILVKSWREKKGSVRFMTEWGWGVWTDNTLWLQACRGTINMPSSSTVQLQSASLHCNCSISCAGTHMPSPQRVHLSGGVSLHSWLTVWLTAASASLVRGFSVYSINQIINQIAWFNLLWFWIFSFCVVPPALFGQFWGWICPTLAFNTSVNLPPSVFHPFWTASEHLSSSTLDCHCMFSKIFLVFPRFIFQREENGIFPS